MSNPYQNAMNTAQLNPALVQAMAAQAQGGPSNGGPNANSAFATFHHAFQRLQSQESQKLDQQRQGTGMPQQGQQPQQQGGGQQTQQQQFMQMMQQAGMLGQGGQGQGMQSMNAGMQYMPGMSMHGQNTPQGMEMQGQNMSMGMNAMGMNNMGQGGGLNIHSQQQGLDLPGMPENEQGRRQMLQNMLSQQLQGIPQQPQQPQQSQLSYAQSQPPMQQLQSQPQMFNSIPSEQLKEFIRTNPEAIAQIQRRHANNQPAILAELQQMARAAQNLKSLPQQPRAPPVNGMTQNQGQLPQGYLQQQQPPPQLQLSQPQHHQQSMQIRPSPQPQHQRVNSSDFQGFQNMQGMQNQPSGMGTIDPKQMEALQAMKAAQQRGGLVTPQSNGNNLPMISPQPLQPMQMANGQGLSMPQSTPQPQNQQLRQSSQHNIPMQLQQQPQLGGQMNPPTQRTMSQPQVQQTSGPSTMQGQNTPQPQGQSSRASDVQVMIQGWGDNQLLKSTLAVVSKVQSQAQQPSAVNDVTKFHLLQIIAEWKRRGKQPPNDALQTAGIALGNPQTFNRLANSDWATLADYAKTRADAMQSALPQRQAQQNQGPSQPNSRPQGVTGNGSGAQGNSIDVVTPTPLLGNLTPQIPQGSATLGSAFQTPQSQISAQHPMAPINDAQQQSRQPNQAQWLQQQQQQRQQQANQQQQQAQQQIQPSVPGPSSAKPWLNMDFRTEPIPLREDQFWVYLGQLHLKREEPLSPPQIDGKAVNLYLMFTLVHRNGGGAKIANSSTIWSFMGGYLGFGSEPGQPGQPARSSPQVADQLRRVYAQLIQPLEDMFYQKLYKDVLKAAAAQSQVSQQNQAPTSQPGMQAPIPLGAQGMSAQFLEAVAKVPGATLTDQQKRMLENARRASQSSQMSVGSQQGSAPSQTTPMNQSQAPLPVQGSSAQQMVGTPRDAQITALKSNPAMMYQWIKSREDAMKSKFPNEFRNLPDEEKPRLVAEIQSLLPSAREAQEKTPRFLAVALDNAREDVPVILTLISMYIFVFALHHDAEAGRFPFSLSDLAKMRDQLNRTLFKLNQVQKQLESTLEGQLHLQRLFATLEAAHVPGNTSMPPPSSLPNAEEIATKLPKGLRVEDLKAPPAKRQRGANAGRGVASPAGSAPAATPEAAKTPAGTADSPAQPGSSSKKGAAASNKRKRQPSAAAKTPKLVAEVRADLPRSAPTPTQSRDMGKAQNNALGIKLDVVEAEIQEHAPFFATYNSLRAKDTETQDPSPELWSALTAALDEYHATMGLTNGQTTDGYPASSAQNANLANGLNVTVGGLDNNDIMNGMGNGSGDDELFERFIDVSKIDDGWTLPTPELFRVNSREEDVEGDTSPESVRTVGSTTGFGKTPAASGIGQASVSVVKADGVDHKEGEDEEAGLTAILGGMGSPESKAYNGTIFGGWDEEGFDFGMGSNTA